MKNTSKVACMVATLIVLACTMLFSACQKEYSVSKGPEAPELEGIDSVKVEHQLLLEDESEYANGKIRFTCLDSVWAYKGGVAHPGTAHCVCTWGINPSEELRNLPDTCMAINATADPRNLVFGNNTVVTLLSAEIRDALVSIDGIEYSVKSTLMAQGHKCLTVPYRLCTNGNEVTFWGRSDDGDTIPATGDRGTNTTTYITDTTYIRDTVVIERNDTVFVIEYDTTLVVDTITNDTTYYVVDSVVMFAQHMSERNGQLIGSTLRFGCDNKLNIITYRNGQVYSTNPQNFAGIFDFLHNESGNYTTDHVGMARAIGANGVVNWGNGYSETFVHQPHYTTPSGYEAWLRYLDCDFILDSVYGQSNGILVAGHYVCPNGQHRKTLLIPKTPQTPQDTTTRRIIGRDTNWSCGSVTSHSVSSNSITHNINRTGVETVHYNVGIPLTVTNNLSQSGSYVDSYTFSGSVSPTLIGTTVPVTFTANGLSFSFGTVLYTVTLGPQAFCLLQYGATVTLTSDGPELSWTYNGQVGYDTLNVNWYHPLTGKRVIEAWATYAYPSNTAAPEEWFVLYTEDLATGQRYFEYIPHTTGYITYSSSIVTNIVAISSSDTVAIRNQINLGRYGARMYDHRDGHYGQWLPGFTHAVTNGTSGSGSTSTTSWTDTYWGLTGVEMNHVDLVVATTDSNSGNSRRGIGNGTYVEADNSRLYY